MSSYRTIGAVAKPFGIRIIVIEKAFFRGKQDYIDWLVKN